MEIKIIIEPHLVGETAEIKLNGFHLWELYANIRGMLEKQNKYFKVYKKASKFSRWKRMYTINDLERIMKYE